MNEQTENIVMTVPSTVITFPDQIKTDESIKKECRCLYCEECL